LAHRCVWVTKETVPNMLLGHWLLSFTQENAVDLHSVGKNPLTLATMGGETYGSSKKKVSFTS